VNYNGKEETYKTLPEREAAYFNDFELYKENRSKNILYLIML
jgi:hypothetical protein